MLNNSNKYYFDFFIASFVTEAIFFTINHFYKGLKIKE